MRMTRIPRAHTRRIKAAMHSAMRVNPASSVRGTGVSIRPSSRLSVQPFRSLQLVVRADAPDATERLRLHNLSPWDGSRRQEKRKGRGYGAGQGGTCGFGNRGQNSRSGSSVRPGFEGGQMPLYRKLPKLRGIAGGMSAGLPKYITVNLDDLSQHFEAGQEVTLEALKSRGLLNTSGREDKLPLKVLGDGEVSFALSVKAAKFSATAAEKIAAAGGSIELVAGRKKWTKWGYKKEVADLKAKGLDYAKVQQQKRVQKALAKKKRHAEEVEARRVSTKPAA